MGLYTLRANMAKERHLIDSVEKSLMDVRQAISGVITKTNAYMGIDSGYNLIGDLGNLRILVNNIMQDSAHLPNYLYYYNGETTTLNALLWKITTQISIMISELEQIQASPVTVKVKMFRAYSTKLTLLNKWINQLEKYASIIKSAQFKIK